MILANEPKFAQQWDKLSEKTRQLQVSSNLASCRALRWAGSVDRRANAVSNVPTVVIETDALARGSRREDLTCSAALMMSTAPTRRTVTPTARLFPGRGPASVFHQSVDHTSAQHRQWYYGDGRYPSSAVSSASMNG
jgi:hypothetical protein